VIVSLPTPDIVRDVALGEDGIASGTRVKAAIDLSTTGPRMTQAVAAGLKAKDIALIDSR
jgi:3-hydroxyisobutyrate dehydrogenase-like beta-hydroxyacid dehydrogenase